VPASRLPSAFTTSSTIASGTKVRRMAVHFCPAFTGHLARDLLDEQVELLGARPRVGPSIEKLSESASWLNRTLCSMSAGVLRSISPWPRSP
jgi:hypothetical protein